MSNGEGPFRFGVENPFSGAASSNPFTSLPSLQLVKVPDAPETHERRLPRRAYLAQPGGGGMDDLISALGGRRPKVIERVRTVREEPEEPEEEPQDMGPKAGPPAYGKR